MSEESVTCYKMVFVNAFDSLTSYAAAGAAEVVYEPGQWVEAPEYMASAGYHLLVFDTLKQALSFTRGAPVWEAECMEEITELPRFAFTIEYSYGTAPLQDLLHDGLHEWPRGTRMFKRVKLLRKVH